jgi:hypothetical protein
MMAVQVNAKLKRIVLVYMTLIFKTLYVHVRQLTTVEMEKLKFNMVKNAMIKT